MKKWKEDNLLRVVETNEVVKRPSGLRFCGLEDVIYIRNVPAESEVMDLKTGKKVYYGDLEDALYEKFKNLLNAGYITIRYNEDEDDAFERFCNDNPSLIRDIINSL